MEFRVHEIEDYENTIRFLELEKKLDEENCRAMLLIEPSHLTKGKITELGKLAGRYKKASDSLIKGYKKQQKNKNKYERESQLERKKTWFIT